MAIYDKKFNDDNESELFISEGSHFEDCEFSRINFSSLNLKSVLFINCKFSNCNFANQSMINSTMTSSRFESCNMIGINWCVLKKVENIQFTNCKINFSSFQELKLKKIKVENCQCIDVDFSSADVSFGNFQYSVLTGSNFNGAIIESADFRKAKDYLFDLRKSKIKGVKLSMPEALNLMTVLGAEIEF